MATYTWSIASGNQITGTTYIKDTDNKIQATMDDLADFVNSEGDYAGQGLTYDFVNKASAQTITGIKTFSNGIVSNVTGNITGNSDTATKLANARTIGGVSFDGSANINLPGVNTTGNQNTTGNAATSTLATKANSLNASGNTLTFNWSGQSGQPAWLFGSNDGSNAYVWNPSNFNVNYANSSNYSNTSGSSSYATSSGSASNGVISSSNTQDGYIKFGNGLIIQWGVYAPNIAGNSTTGAIGFSIAFPNAIASLQLTDRSTSTAGEGAGWSWQSSNTSSFTITNPSGDTRGNVYWFAIGY